MTTAKELKYNTGIGGMESVTELHVEIDGEEYYVLITDIGEFQKLYIFKESAIDSYEELCEANNNDFDGEIEKFEAEAFYIEDKDADAWYIGVDAKFENAVKLAALLGKEWPGGYDMQVFEESAMEAIADYLGKNIDKINLPETYSKNMYE